MADIFSISISALKAFQKGITVTGNNIANASTPGYSRQVTDLVTSKPQFYGNGWVGSGVDVAGVTRSYDQATANQYNNSQSALGQANALKSYSDQLDGLFNTTGGGISASVQKFFSAAADVSNDRFHLPAQFRAKSFRIPADPTQEIEQCACGGQALKRAIDGHPTIQAGTVSKLDQFFQASAVG